MPDSARADRWITSEARGSKAGHLGWLIGAVLVGLLISFIFADVLSVPRPWFVLAHAVISGAFLAGYIAWLGLDLKRLFLRHPGLGVIAGVVAAAFAVHFMLSAPGSARPEGIELVWAVLWLGVVYCAVDALLLTVMPVYAVWSIGFELGWPGSWPGRIGTGLVALLASALVAAAYHLGFPEFQDPQLVQPLIGNTKLRPGLPAQREPDGSRPGARGDAHRCRYPRLRRVDSLPPHY